METYLDAVDDSPGRQLRRHHSQITRPTTAYLQRKSEQVRERIAPDERETERGYHRIKILIRNFFHAAAIHPQLLRMPPRTAPAGKG